MAAKLLVVSVLLLQLAATALSIRPYYAKHNPKKGIKGGHPGGIPAVPGGPAGGIPKPGAAAVGGAHQGGVNSGKKWCIGRKDIMTSTLKKQFEVLCTQVDCSATGPTGLCYDESWWSKASYAMNIKYQQNGQKGSACDPATSLITTVDPSWGKCVYKSNQELKGNQ